LAVHVVRRWSWIGVLVVGLVLFWAVQRALLTTQNPNLVPTLILLGAAVMPVTFVAFIAARRLPYGVGGTTIGLTALVGGIVGVVAAGVLEYDVLHELGVVPMIAVGFIEEAAKLIVLVVLVIWLRPRRRADGLVLGVAAGAGFAVLETMGYAFVALIQSGGDLGALDDLLLLRGLLSPAAHMAWTGLSAAALWIAADSGLGRSGVRFVAVFLVAVGLHAAWDSFNSIWAYVVIAALSLGLLTVTAHRLGERHQLASVGPG
jgi:RsiW-degrading membrane proteinase PrsW (M82 family)